MAHLNTCKQSRLRKAYVRDSLLIQCRRPDIGGALVPWIYSVVVIAVHFPVLWERIHDWEKVQTLSLCLAVFNIAITMAGYISSKFDPGQVLVWMPLTSTLDAGAMLQLIVLILEKDGGSKKLCRAAHGVIHRWTPRGLSRWTDLGGYVPANQDMQSAEAESKEVTGNTACADSSKADPAHDKVRGRRAFVAIAAFVLLLIIVCLQIVGLAYTIKGRTVQDLKVAYCSASLDNVAVAVYDADVLDPTTNCGTFHSLTISVNKGISCIQLPASRQRNWLLCTMIILPVCLVFQLIDFLILRTESTSKSKDPEKTGAHGKHMRRPWLTVRFLALV